MVRVVGRIDMNQVQEATETLIAAIKESEEYNRYQRAKQELKRYPAFKTAGR